MQFILLKEVESESVTIENTQPNERYYIKVAAFNEDLQEGYESEPQIILTLQNSNHKRSQLVVFGECKYA